MMRHTDISRHERWFANYAALKRAEARDDTAPLDLKIRHTGRVLANAREIVGSERFSSLVARSCLLAALYHDVARFEQYLRYHTFKDKESRNHGLMGVKVLKRERPLDGEERIVRHTVLAAVALHNRFALPRRLPESLHPAARVVRDSDKLDILRVIDEHLGGPKPYCPTVVLSLPDSPDIVGEAVLDAALAGRVAAYADLRSVNDFRLLLGTWFFDMNFPASRNRFVRDGHAARLLEALPPTGPYGPAREYLLAHCRARSESRQFRTVQPALREPEQSGKRGKTRNRHA
ncbi:MAG: HD domain-containing protein [Desulfovibrio sp.]|jgi:hypothetical protein|nr:HD domain-containing protein [Desulfovibrio sp.]